MGEECSGSPRSGRTKVTLSYPPYSGRPEDLLDFIELPQFTRRWEKLGLDDEDDLTALQLFIMANPKLGQPVAGMNGVRKFRFAPARWNAGKSGGVRILYVYFEEFGMVLLCLVYGKNEVSNISDAVKTYISKIVEAQERELRRRKSL